jgi:LacI family transcriptional regulator
MAVGQAQPLTLRDIARVTGVSVNTVSRALTGKSDINADTKARVLHAAEQLGYRPNLLARSLVQGRTRTLGLLVTDCTHPFYAMLIREVEHVAARNNYSLLLATSNERSEREAAALQLLTQRRADGVLLAPVQVEAPHLLAFANGAVPSVLLTRRPQGYKGPFVGTDNVVAARKAIRYLLELGHRRIAHLTLAEGGSSATERSDGYRQEMRAARLGAANMLELAAPQSIGGGRAAVGRLLEQRTRPTAVFAYNDLQAVGLLLGLREAGIAVPSEMSVIGFDGIDLGEVVYPPLTTVAQQIDRIGNLGTQLLLDILAGKSGRRTNILPSELIVRGSTGVAAR